MSYFPYSSDKMVIISSSQRKLLNISLYMYFFQISLFHFYDASNISGPTTGQGTMKDLAFSGSSDGKSIKLKVSEYIMLRTIYFLIFL